MTRHDTPHIDQTSERCIRATSEETLDRAIELYERGQLDAGYTVFPPSPPQARRMRQSRERAARRGVAMHAASLVAEETTTLARTRGATDHEVHLLRCHALYGAYTACYQQALGEKRMAELIGGNTL